VDGFLLDLHVHRFYPAAPWHVNNNPGRFCFFALAGKMGVFAVDSTRVIGALPSRRYTRATAGDDQGLTVARKLGHATI
jgi:hypothetical protein